jgi:hypothetical protein
MSMDSVAFFTQKRTPVSARTLLNSMYSGIPPGTSKLCRQARQLCARIIDYSVSELEAMAILPCYGVPTPTIDATGLLD